jgi:N-acetylglucosamine-6-sulfatase
MVTAHTRARVGSQTARRAVRAAAAFAATCALGAAGWTFGPDAAGAKKEQGRGRPNVVVVMSDDQTSDSMRFMNAVNAQVGDAGATFQNSFASFPLCCPSRATFLTGQYPHNHGVMANVAPDGGFAKLDSSNTLPVWLQQAGYHTAHVGKYLNGYEGFPDLEPPGWSEWYGSTRTYQFYGYTLNENGTQVTYGTTADQYQTDVYTQKAVEFIDRRAPEEQPFFLSVAYLAPHSGGPNVSPQPPSDCQRTAKPAPRHATAFDSEALPLPASFNEEDVSDKPQEIQALAPLTADEIVNIERRYRCRIESLLAVDEGVARILDALARNGELSNTLLIYTADNGFFHGEHRIPAGKHRFYEPSARVPLLIRGPGIPPNVEVADLAVNADLAPTILEAAGATAARAVDGRSLLGAAENPGRLLGRSILIETRNYSAVRTARYKFAVHDTGEVELYDLQNDPDEVQSLHADPAFDQVESALATLLSNLQSCSGASCQALPGLKLKLDYKRGEDERGRRCAEGAVKATVKGSDRSAVIATEFAVGSRAVGSDDAAPFRERIPRGELKKKGKSSVIVTVTLLDGRVRTVDERVRRCS